jgi:hypothetical protein
MGIPPTTPPGGGSPPSNPLDSAAQTLKDAAEVMSKGMGDILDQLKGTNAGLGKVADESNRLTFSLKAAVNQGGDLKDILSDVMNLSKKVATGGIFSTKTYSGAQKYLQEYIRELQNLMKRTDKSAVQHKQLEFAIKKAGDALGILQEKARSAGKSMEQMGNLGEDAALAMNKPLMESVKYVDRLNESIRKVNFGPITNTAKSVNTLLGRSGRIEKFVRYAQAAHEANEVLNLKKAGNRNDFEKKRNDLRRSLGKKGDYLDLRFNPDGSVDRTHFNRRNILPSAKRNATAAVGAGGFGAIAAEGGARGFIDKFLSGQAHKAIARGAAKGELGMVGGMGAKLLNLGGGSVLSGVGSLMESGAVGGGAGMMQLAGKLAVPLAILGAVKDVFDKTAQMNSDVEKGLGGAGIFGGGGTGFRNLQSVRDNLTPGGSDRFYSGLNVTYERQLNVAKAMAASGVNVGELAQQGGGGAIRGIAHTAFVGARLAGMDETAGTQQIMKLLQQYHETIKGTDVFFDKLNKDTRAAGLTTSKYLQIIDEVTAGFDHMARSLDDVTSIMRVLGSSGTQNAEMMKGSMTHLMGPENRGIEKSAFLAQILAQNPEAAQQYISGRRGIAKASGDKALESLAAAGVDTTGLTAEMLSTPEGVNRARMRLFNATQGGAGNVLTQAAGANVDQAMSDALRYSKAKRLGVGDYLGFAGSEELTPKDASDRMREQATALSATLKLGGTNWAQAMSTPSVLQQGQLPLLLSGLANALGTDPKSLLGVMSSYQAGASSLVGQAVGGTGSISDDEYARILRVAQTIPGITMKGGTPRQQIRSLEGNTEAIEALSEKLSSDEFTMGELITRSSELRKSLDGKAAQEDKAAQEAKARSIAIATRTTADVFAAAFTNLFNSISEPVTYVSEILEKWANNTWDSKGGGEFHKLTDGEKAAVADTVNDPAFQYVLDRLSARRDALAASDDPNDKEKANRIAEAIQRFQEQKGLPIMHQSGVANLYSTMDAVRRLDAQSDLEDRMKASMNGAGTNGFLGESITGFNGALDFAKPNARANIFNTTYNTTGVNVYKADLDKTLTLGTHRSGESTAASDGVADFTKNFGKK